MAETAIVECNGIIYRAIKANNGEWRGTDNKVLTGARVVAKQAW